MCSAINVRYVDFSANASRSHNCTHTSPITVNCHPCCEPMWTSMNKTLCHCTKWLYLSASLRHIEVDGISLLSRMAIFINISHTHCGGWYSTITQNCYNIFGNLCLESGIVPRNTHNPQYLCTYRPMYIHTHIYINITYI